MTTENRRRWLALYVLCAGVLMGVIDATIVNVALPSIKRDLGFSQSGLAWVLNAYLISFGGLLLLAGRIGDLVGQRRVFLAGLGVFTTASALCGLAPDQGVLVGARFVQGVGGAMTAAVILGMIVTMFPEPREQAKAIGVYGFVAAGGGSIGLLAGGVLTQAISWHWIFFINVPIGLATAVLAVKLIDDRPGIGFGQGADIPGAVMLTVALMLGVYTILQVSSTGWGSTTTLVLGGLAAGLLAAFIARQDRVANPLMPLRLFRSRQVSGANFVQALLVVGMFGMFFLGALYLQQILGYDALRCRPGVPAGHDRHGRHVAALLGAARDALRPGGHARPGPGGDRRRAGAVRADARARFLRDGHPAVDGAARSWRRPGLPGADHGGDVGRHAERLGTGLGRRQHVAERRRGVGSRGARHLGDRAHPRAARRRCLGRVGAQLGLSPGLSDLGRAGRGRGRGRAHGAASALRQRDPGQQARGRAPAAACADNA